MSIATTNSSDLHRIPNIPPAAYYISDFVTPEEEVYLLKKIEQSPQPKWKRVATGRRLQYWGGTMSKGGVLLPEKLPDFLTTFPNMVERINNVLEQIRAMNTPNGTESQSISINQVLVNEYHPGQGISPHEDGPAFHPLVATLSLGAHTILDIHHYISEADPSPPMTASETTRNRGKAIAAVPLAHLLLLPRSLLILSSSLYTSHLHGITERKEDVVVDAEGVNRVGLDTPPIVIANVDQLGDPAITSAIKNNAWTGTRKMRTSLTFRQAFQVFKGGSFSTIGGLRKP